MEPALPTDPDVSTNIIVSTTFKSFDEKLEYIRGTLDVFTQPGCTYTQPNKVIISKSKKQRTLFVEHKEDISPIEDQPRPTTSNSQIPERLLLSQNNHTHDRRISVDSNKLMLSPYSNVVRLELQFGKRTYMGSGALVGPRHVLTAAHNVYEPNHGGWVQDVRIIPGQDGTSAPFGDAYVCHAYKFDTYDLALLILDVALGEELGWFGLMCYDNLESLKREQLIVTGYPNINKQTDKMHTHSGALKHCKEDDLAYDIDTSPGQSGSPVWIERKDQNYLVGVHTHSGFELENVNHGIPIFQSLFKKVIQWIEETYSIKNIKGSFGLIGPYRLQVEQAINNLKEGWKEYFLFDTSNEVLNIHKRTYQADGMNINGDMTEELFEDFVKIFQNIPKSKFRNFKINVEGCPFEYKAIKQIYELQNSKSFVTLRLVNNPPWNWHLKFENLSWKYVPEYSEEDFLQLRKVLALSENLQDLYLRFNMFSEAADSLDYRIFDVIMKTNLASLQKLTLKVSTVNKENGHALRLLESIFAKGNLISLKKLSLDISGWRNTSIEALNRFFKEISFKNFPELEHLELQAGFLPVKYQWEMLGISLISVFCNAFLVSNLTQLRKLDLHFGGVSLSKKGTKQLIDTITDLNLKQLDHLGLYYSRCADVLDSTLEYLWNAITSSQLCHLKELCLEVKPFGDITDESIADLATKIAKISQLEHLRLKFSQCLLIEGEALGDLMAQLAGLQKLRHLHLHFQTLSSISDESVVEFLSGVIKLSQLQQLELFCTGSPPVPEDLYCHFINEMINMPNLQHLLFYSPNGVLQSIDPNDLLGIPQKDYTTLKFEYPHNFSLFQNSDSKDLVVIPQKGYMPLRLEYPLNTSEWTSSISNLIDILQAFSAKKDAKLESLRVCFERFDSETPSLVSNIDFEKFHADNLFQHLRHLRGLVINLGDCKISTKSFKSLWQQLTSANLVQVQQLVLQFDECIGITDESLSKIINTISSSHLKQLEVFNISFKNCKGITLKSLNLLRTTFTSKNYPQLVRFDCSIVESKE